MKKLASMAVLIGLGLGGLVWSMQMFEILPGRVLTVAEPSGEVGIVLAHPRTPKTVLLVWRKSMGSSDADLVSSIRIEARNAGWKEIPQVPGETKEEDLCEIKVFPVRGDLTRADSAGKPLDPYLSSCNVQHRLLSAAGVHSVMYNLAEFARLPNSAPIMQESGFYRTWPQIGKTVRM